MEVFTQIDGSDVIIAVRDHGPGVPEHDLGRIFEAFYRVAEARDRGSGGTGLGLAITARVMALHRGYAKARNSPDGGLVVELCFPEGGMSRISMVNSVELALGRQGVDDQPIFIAPASSPR